MANLLMYTPYTAKMDHHARLAVMASAASRPRQRGSQQGRWPDGRPKPTLARSPGSRQHPSMASSPSAAFLRLRAFIAERMRMSAASSG